MLDNFIASKYVTRSINERFSVFAGNSLAKFIRVLFEQFLILEHVPNASRYGDFFPCFESLFCVEDSFVELCFSALGDFSDRALGEWTYDVNVRCGFAINPLAIDKVFVDLAKGSAIALVQHY
jgi:hypothetical protein